MQSIPGNMIADPKTEAGKTAKNPIFDTVALGSRITEFR